MCHLQRGLEPQPFPPVPVLCEYLVKLHVRIGKAFHLSAAPRKEDAHRVQNVLASGKLVNISVDPSVGGLMVCLHIKLFHRFTHPYDVGLLHKH